MKLCKTCKWKNQCNDVADYADKINHFGKEFGLKVKYEFIEYCDSYSKVRGNGK